MSISLTTTDSHQFPEVRDYRATIREIGLQLDRQQFPRVFDGGFVLPSESGVYTQPMGRENCDGNQRSTRPPTRPRQRTAGRQGSTRGSRPSRTAASVVDRSPQEAYERDLNLLRRAYPSSQTWHQKNAMWLLARSAIVHGLDREAVFVVALPYDPLAGVRAWGFWDRHCLVFAQWIGPRHTNFPDGSICAFDVRDGTWRHGDSIVQLLDLYTVWAARHLHLELFARWPGSQVARWAYERQLETHPDELCSCGSFDRTYAECCRPKDQQRNCIADALRYIRDTDGGKREPPDVVIKFLRTQVSLPDLSELA